jgi:hypothetical protein
VATCLRPSLWCTFAILKDLKGNSNIVHLQLESIHPQSIAIDSIQLLGPDQICGNFNPILVCLHSHPCLHSRKDRFPSPQGMRYPSSKGLICYASRLSKLSQFNWIGILELCKLHPGLCPILPIHQKTPALGSLSQALLARPCRKVLVMNWNRRGFIPL